MIGNFKDNGMVYSIDMPITPRKWANKLFNDHYVLELDAQLQGVSTSFENYRSTPLILDERHIYILNRDTNEVFCPLYAPLKSKSDSFERKYAPHYDEIESTVGEMKTTVRVFVSASDKKEFWTVKIENVGREAKELSVFTAFSLDIRSYMGSCCHYDEESNSIYRYSYPGHAKYEDKALLDEELKYTYIHCDTKPASYDTNKFRFYGCEDTTEMPLAVRNGVCSNTCTQGEEGMIAAFEHRILLGAGEIKEIAFIAGAVSHKRQIQEEAMCCIKTEFEKVEALWKRRLSFCNVKSGNKAIDNVANVWLKKQLTYMARTNRMYFMSPVRNELQDIMGYAYVEPSEAWRLLKLILKRQYQNGDLKQWNAHDGSPGVGLVLLRHSDAPLWLMICTIEIISYILKDESLYNEKVAFCDSDEEVTVLEHLRRAAYFMSSEEELGEHGICLMRDGDWTDPINAVGRKGKGESVWNSMTLIYAINELCKIERDTVLAERATNMKADVNKYCWDGEWYLAAIDDDGRKVGTNDDEEGKILLNPQTWAIISGVAEGERLQILKNSIESLKTDFGYKLSEPPFTKWNEKFGKISIKQLGALENGSVYCHGTMFKAFADFLTGDKGAALACIEATLPTNPKNPNEVNLQLPLYASNYYFGVKNENYGRSSCAYGTGTTAWIMVILGRMGMIE